MKEQKDLFELADDTKEATKLYVEYKLDYYKLHVAERLTNLATFTIGGILFLVLLSLFLLFLSLAAAMVIGDALGNGAYGFLIVGTFYLIGLGLLSILRGRLIEKPILRIVIRELFPKSKRRKL